MPVWMIADVFLMNSSKLKKLGQGLTNYVHSDEHAHIMCAKRSSCEHSKYL